MWVLVTRPADSAVKLTEQLALRGHDALIAPLLAVRLLDGPEISLEGVQAVLATSGNGVRALGQRTPRRDVPVFAVGTQTAETARALGFARVEDAQGDVDALARATEGWATPAGGALFHARGADGDGPLALLLHEKGFEVLSEVLYTVEAAKLLPEAARMMLAKRALDAALFFSPRSARIFRNCVQRAAVSTAPLIAVCISKATADGLDPLPFREMRIAPQPNQNAMLEALG
jgi:uroporphyrinogen-III synthase